MAWKTIQYQLNSSAPLLLHNGQTADPLNKWAKLIKVITSKRKKTDADHEEIARLEFYAGLYLDADGPILPNNMIDALIINAAKKFNEGPMAKSGCLCLEHAKLEYEGPRTADELWADENFRFSAIVRVGTSRLPRMRPIFQEWSTIITLQIENSLINITRMDEWLDAAGKQVGLGDWRPVYGRFTAKRVNGK